MLDGLVAYPIIFHNLHIHGSFLFFNKMADVIQAAGDQILYLKNVMESFLLELNAFENVIFNNENNTYAVTDLKFRVTLTAFHLGVSNKYKQLLFLYLTLKLRYKILFILDYSRHQRRPRVSRF